jgi:hypothetical protein
MRQLILLLITASVCSQDLSKLPLLNPQPDEDAEAYKVYSALLAETRKPLFVRYDTVGYSGCLSSVRDKDKSAASAFDDYLKVNLTRYALQNKFSLPKPPKLIGPREIKAMYEERQKERQTRGFFAMPGYFVFSAVGFNANRTIAVVNIYYVCGGLCGEGHLAVLRKFDGVWKETKEDRGCFTVS